MKTKSWEEEVENVLIGEERNSHAFKATDNPLIVRN